MSLKFKNFDLNFLNVCISYFYLIFVQKFNTKMRLSK